MKLTKSEYEEMIRKKPSLRPTEVIKSQSTHKANEKMLNAGLDICFVGALGILDLEEPFNVLPDQEKPVKSPPTLKFTIPGQPVGKPRMTVRDKWFKRPCVVKYWAWAEVARNSVPQRTILGIYREISFVAYLEIPKSYSKAKRTLLTGQPHLGLIDGDNILKALQDSLFKQDKYIWKFSGEKRWDDGQGARIEVELR